MKYAIVKFLSSKDEGYSQGYAYMNTVKAKPYDAVIVPTRYGLSLAVVESLTDDPVSVSGFSFTTVKAIAEVIKSDAVEEVMREEKKKALKKQLEAQVKKLDDVTRYEMYAEQSPEVAKLLKEYKEL